MYIRTNQQLGSLGVPSVKRKCKTSQPPAEILDHFRAYKTDLRKFHYEQLDQLTNKIAQSFRGKKPITTVQIVGHSSTWKGISKAAYAKKAQERAQKVADALKSRLKAQDLSSKVKITVDNRADDCPLPGVDNMIHSSGNKALENRALNRRVEIFLTSKMPPKKKSKPKPSTPDAPSKLPTPPKIPKVTPRLMREHEFTRTERAFARKAWKKAVKYVYHTRWFINYMARQDAETRIKLWNGTASFPGNYNWGVPRVWFGDYDDVRFDNIHHVVNRIWQKFRRSPWKMKRHDCAVWASAHVIVAGQIRLCDNFFGNLSATALSDATMILVHEMSHHIWIKSPRRQLKDRHVAPIPPCGGPCYGPGNAQRLAKDYPKHAVANPDNYALFTRYYGSYLPGG